MEIFYVHDIPYIHVDWETSKASDTESEAMAFLTGEMGMMPINSTIVDNKLLCDIPKKLIVGMYGLKVVWVKKSASGKKSEDILESDIQSISRIHDLFGITSSQYAVTYTGSEITFHVRSNPTPYFYSPIGSWRSVPMSLDGVNYSDDSSIIYGKRDGVVTVPKNLCCSLRWHNHRDVHGLECNRQHSGCDKRRCDGIHCSR